MTVLGSLGIAGAAFAIVAYVLLARGHLTIRGYAVWSLVASALIGASLFEQFNAATAIIQVFFAGVSLYILGREA